MQSVALGHPDLVNLYKYPELHKDCGGHLGSLRSIGRLQHVARSASVHASGQERSKKSRLFGSMTLRVCRVGSAGDVSLGETNRLIFK